MSPEIPCRPSTGVRTSEVRARQPGTCYWIEFVLTTAPWPFTFRELAGLGLADQCVGGVHQWSLFFGTCMNLAAAQKNT